MRLRFLAKVAVPGGPLYNAGDVAETDPHFITAERAADYIARGWAQEDQATDAATKAPLAPDVDRMITRDKAAVKTK
jgi:hypothetical protein